MLLRVIYQGLYGGWLCAMAMVVYADTVPNLYEATIPVRSQDREERDDAIRLALVEVLVRVSGRNNIAESEEYPRIKGSLVNATNYAQQFRFRDKTPNKYSAAAELPLELWVKFDPVVVNKLLRDNNVPIWDKTRPGTLLWLVVEERGQRELFSQGSNNVTRAVLDERARIRGLPIHYPLLDVTDSAALQVSEVWGNVAEVILQASQRYQNESVLVGRLSHESSGLWTARWTLYHDGRKQDWNASAVAMNQAIDLAINGTTDYLASRYAQVSQAEDSIITVQIKDIKSLTDYNRTVKYLRSLTQTKAVNLLSVQADSAVFKVTTSVGRLGLARSIALSQILLSDFLEKTPQNLPNIQGQLSPANVVAGSVAPVVPDLVYRLSP